MSKKSLTESNSLYDHLDQMPVLELLMNINQEDQKVANAVKESLPQVERLVMAILPRMQQGGRLFYIGAGTSGRLGIVDASECPPTFGVESDLVVGLIAGGDGAIRKAVEFAEDDEKQGWVDLQEHEINPEKDSVIGIAASGQTPYVIGAVQQALSAGCVTGCITCNEASNLASSVSFPVEILVGPEFVTGSTRMKAGTAQKLVLNMLSTALMIQLGHVKGNKMVDMKLSNQKLISRGVHMIVDELNVTIDEAKDLLDKHGSVRDVLKNHLK